MQENTTLNHDIEQSSIRELSLDETEAVGGGFSWGRLVHGIEHLGQAVEKGMVAGAITGAVGGAVAGEGAGAAPGAVVGSIVGAVGGAVTFLGL
jgi:hypothetical protein